MKMTNHVYLDVAYSFRDVIPDVLVNTSLKSLHMLPEICCVPAID